MLLLAAGIAIGGGLTSLKAQVTKKPAFVIAEVDVTDEAAFKAYAAKVPDTLKPYNARIIIRGKPDNKEGEPPKGITSRSRLTAWTMRRSGTATLPIAC